MDDIFHMLVETIERGSFSYFYAKSEYRQSQYEALQHSQWLEEHLDDEEKAHWEKLRDADLGVDILEREALIRTALAVGIRLALSC